MSTDYTTTHTLHADSFPDAIRQLQALAPTLPEGGPGGPPRQARIRAENDTREHGRIEVRIGTTRMSCPATGPRVLAFADRIDLMERVRPKKPAIARGKYAKTGKAYSLRGKRKAVPAC